MMKKSLPAWLLCLPRTAIDGYIFETTSNRLAPYTGKAFSPDGAACDANRSKDNDSLQIDLL